MLLGKIHRATVTGAELQYEGSITVDADLLDAAGILEHEAVHVWDVTKDRQARSWQPRVVLVDSYNNVIEIRPERLPE
jgi:aspartate 1-decarboxylase